MKKRLNLNDYYQTSDLGLATTISIWYPIEAIDKTNPRKAKFIFKRDDNFDKLIEKYWKRELKVEPQQYNARLRAIKTRLYENEQ